MRYAAIVNLTLTLTVVAAHAAEAAPIAYDEAIAGDLSGHLPYDFIGTLDSGVNTVAGTTFATSDSSGFSVDIDSFSFDVPVGLAVTQWSFTWDLVALGSVDTAQISFGLDSGGSSLSFAVIDLLQSSPPFTVVTSATGSQTLFGPVLPAGPGRYEIANSLFGIGGPGSIQAKNWTASYEWTITTAPAVVPEPSTLLLMSIGLIGLTVSRRGTTGRRN